jgi:hypothetical protein
MLLCVSHGKALQHLNQCGTREIPRPVKEIKYVYISKNILRNELLKHILLLPSYSFVILFHL